MEVHMADIYRGDSDKYKEQVITEALMAMDVDKWNLTRLKNDRGRAINLDKNIMEIIKGYYQGKIIMIGE